MTLTTIKCARERERERGVSVMSGGGGGGTTEGGGGHRREGPWVKRRCVCGESWGRRRGKLVNLGDMRKMWR